MCTFFAAYLVLDLLVGWVEYRRLVNVWTGWCHHVCYLWLMVVLVERRLTTPFVLFAVMEAPTFVLALGHIWKPWRRDWLFGGAFFLTRILLHTVLLHQFYYRFPVQGPWWLVVAAAYLLHWHWFIGWIKQQQRLRLRRLRLRQQNQQEGDQQEGNHAAARGSKSTTPVVLLQDATEQVVLSGDVVVGAKDVDADVPDNVKISIDKKKNKTRNNKKNKNNNNKMD